MQNFFGVFLHFYFGIDIEEIAQDHTETAFEDAYNAAVAALDAVATAGEELDTKKAQLMETNAYAEEKEAELDEIVAQAKEKIATAETVEAVSQIVTATNEALEDVWTVTKETSLVAELKEFVEQHVAVEEPDYTGDDIRYWDSIAGALSAAAKKTIDPAVLEAFEKAVSEVENALYEIETLEPFEIDGGIMLGKIKGTNVTFDPGYAKTGENMMVIAAYKMADGTQALTFIELENETVNEKVFAVAKVNGLGASFASLTVYVYDLESGDILGSFDDTELFPNEISQNK